jgi:HEPN domain-containing protein
VTNLDLAKSYIWKAETRLDASEALRKRKNFSDVVREAQETVELALKGMLRAVGVEPPKYHGVGALLLEHRTDSKLSLQRSWVVLQRFPSAFDENGN